MTPESEIVVDIITVNRADGTAYIAASLGQEAETWAWKWSNLEVPLATLETAIHCTLRDGCQDYARRFRVPRSTFLAEERQSRRGL
jgi:hypothetical protein